MGRMPRGAPWAPSQAKAQGMRACFPQNTHTLSAPPFLISDCHPLPQRNPFQPHPAPPLGLAERKRWSFRYLQRALGPEAAEEVLQRRGGSVECNRSCIGGGQSCGSASGPSSSSAFFEPTHGVDVLHLNPGHHRSQGERAVEAPSSDPCPFAPVLGESIDPLPQALSVQRMTGTSATTTASLAACTAGTDGTDGAAGTACSRGCSRPEQQELGLGDGRRPSSVSEEPILAAHPLHIASSYHHVLGKPTANQSMGTAAPTWAVLNASLPPAFRSCSQARSPCSPACTRSLSGRATISGTPLGNQTMSGHPLAVAATLAACLIARCHPGCGPSQCWHHR